MDCEGFRVDLSGCFKKLFSVSHALVLDDATNISFFMLLCVGVMTDDLIQVVFKSKPSVRLVS